MSLKLNLIEKNNEKVISKNKNENKPEGLEDDDNEEQDEGFLSLTHLEEIIRPTIDKEFKRVKAN